MNQYVFLARNYNKDKDKNIHKALRGPGFHLCMAVSPIILEASP